jgi:hypothetical protein
MTNRKEIAIDAVMELNGQLYPMQMEKDALKRLLEMVAVAAVLDYMDTIKAEEQESNPFPSHEMVQQERLLNEL